METYNYGQSVIPVFGMEVPITSSLPNHIHNMASHETRTGNPVTTFQLNNIGEQPVQGFRAPSAAPLTSVENVPLTFTENVPPTPNGPAQPVPTEPAQPAPTEPAQPPTWPTGPVPPRPTGPVQPEPTGPAQPAPTGPAQPAPTGPVQPPRPTGSVPPRPTGPTESVPPRPTGSVPPRPTGPTESVPPRPTGSVPPRPTGPVPPRPTGSVPPRPTGSVPPRPTGPVPPRPTGSVPPRPTGPVPPRPTGPVPPRPMPVPPPSGCINCGDLIIPPDSNTAVLWTWGELSPFFSTSSSIAHVRFYNAAAIQEPVDIYLNGRLVVSNLEYLNNTNYLHIIPGYYRLTIYRNTNTQTPIIDTGIQFNGGLSYTLIILGSPNNYSVQLLTS